MIASYKVLARTCPVVIMRDLFVVRSVLQWSFRYSAKAVGCVIVLTDAIKVRVISDINVLWEQYCKILVCWDSGYFLIISLHLTRKLRPVC